MAAPARHNGHGNGHDSDEGAIVPQHKSFTLSTSSPAHLNGEKMHISPETKYRPSACSIDTAVTSTIQDLERRCQALLAELETFRSHLQSINRDSTVDTNAFRHSLQSEFRSLAKASSLSSSHDTDETSQRAMHLLRSSNLPFLEAVWNTAKRRSNIVGFFRRLYWETSPKKQKPCNNISPGKAILPNPRKNHATIDIVADGGATWIKVSSVSETRLIFELASQGWHEDDSFDFEDSSSDVEDNSAGCISIIRIAKNLVAAAKTMRVRYQHPKVRFVLPRVTMGRIPQIDALLNAVRATGAVLETAGTHEVDAPPAPLATAMSTMITSPYTHFKSTLNIDCTILLALVSDLSHTPSVTTKPWFHKAMYRQIEREQAENLLPSLLYPAMGARKLVCTVEAAQRMREIVEIVGTEKERLRTRILLGDGLDDSLAEEDKQKFALEKMQTLSEYQMPEELKIPVQIIDSRGRSQPLVHEEALLMSKVSGQLSPINRSIFLFGWRMGYTTITSNRTVAKQIEKLIEAELDHRSMPDTKEEVGPNIWVCMCSRSLIGKEKGRK